MNGQKHRNLEKRRTTQVITRPFFHSKAALEFERQMRGFFCMVRHQPELSIFFRRGVSQRTMPLLQKETVSRDISGQAQTWMQPIFSPTRGHSQPANGSIAGSYIAGVPLFSAIVGPVSVSPLPQDTSSARPSASWLLRKQTRKRLPKSFLFPESLLTEKRSPPNRQVQAPRVVLSRFSPEQTDGAAGTDPRGDPTFCSTCVS